MDATKRDLPIAWNWYKRPPAWQVEEILAGSEVMPTLGLGATEDNYKDSERNAERPLIELARARSLPICLRANNVFYDPDSFEWFRQFGYDPMDYAKHAWLVFVKTLQPGEFDPTVQLPARMPGSTNTIIEIHEDGTATYLDTFTKHLSIWSPFTPQWAYKLGWLYATSKKVVELAKAYPNPPIVLCFDNDEIGQSWNFDWPDYRERVHSNRVQLMNEYVAAMEKPTTSMGDNIAIVHRPEWVNYIYTREAWGSFKGMLKGLARNRMYSEFNLGFAAGLATHNQHWANVAGWSNYSQAGESPRNVQCINPKNPLGHSVGYGNGMHRYGATGDIYYHPWIGQWYSVACLSYISNTRMNRDRAMILGGEKPRITLQWENNGRADGPRPDRVQWRGLCRANAWIGDHEFFGHWVSHGTAKDHWKMTTYWPEVKGVVDEIYNDSKLAAWWQTSDIVPSLDCMPNYSNDFSKNSPLLLNQPWFFQYVKENGRYGAELANLIVEGEDAEPIRNKLAMTMRGNDPWRRDGKQEMKTIAVLRKRLMPDGKTKYLFYVAGTREAQAGVTVKFEGLDGKVDAVTLDAPVGGSFVEYDPETRELVDITPSGDDSDTSDESSASSDSTDSSQSSQSSQTSDSSQTSTSSMTSETSQTSGSSQSSSSVSSQSSDSTSTAQVNAELRTAVQQKLDEIRERCNEIDAILDLATA